MIKFHEKHFQYLSSVWLLSCNRNYVYLKNVDIKTKDHAWFVFFQAQLDRIAQLGRMVTPKPLPSYYNTPPPLLPKPNLPSQHGPYTPKPAVPTASYTSNLQPANSAKPSSSSSFSGFMPTPLPYHHTTAGALHEGWWPVGGMVI